MHYLVYRALYIKSAQDKLLDRELSSFVQRLIDRRQYNTPAYIISDTSHMDQYN